MNNAKRLVKSQRLTGNPTNPASVLSAQNRKISAFAATHDGTERIRKCSPRYFYVFACSCIRGSAVVVVLASSCPAGSHRQSLSAVGPIRLGPLSR